MLKTKTIPSFASLIVVMLLNVSFCNFADAQSTTKKETKMGAKKMDAKASKASDEVMVLFDGKSLEHFRSYKTDEVGKGWKIDNGTLMFDGENGGGDIMTKAQYDNFELMFDWKIAEGSNSGVMYRVSTGDSASYFSGPEYQILDDSKHKDGSIEFTSAGSLYALYKPKDKKLKKVGEWNSAKIVLNGNKVEHWLNGKKVVSAELGSDDWNKRVNESKFKKWKKFGKNAKGHICFQDHGDKVWFRDIKIKPIKK